MKIAVISGGFSEEQHSSRDSGKCVADALRNLGHDAAIIEYDKNLLLNIDNFSPEAAFPIVQGKNHGDGAVQALLKLAGIPYVGSQPQNAAIINHKTVCKKIWRAAGILTPDFFEYSRDEYTRSSFGDFENKAKANGLTLPVVVKPPTQGNRFGMVFMKGKSSFKKLAESFCYDNTLLVEAYVEGRFYTQGVLEIDGKLTALPPVEIIDSSDTGFKLYPGGSAVIAHDFTTEQLEEITHTTLEAARLIGVGGFARLDYHLSKGVLYLLEINAVPGLIPGYSSMNVCADTAGYDYDTFIGLLLATAK